MNVIHAWRYRVLLLCQVALFVLAPLFNTPGITRWLFALVVTVLFTAAVYSVSRQRKRVFIALVIMLPALLGFWMGQAEGVGSGPLLPLISALLFFSYVATLILGDIMKVRDVSADTIAGGISIYLLLGIVWAFAYMIIGQLEPDAFIIPETSLSLVSDQMFNLGTAIYYSFVNLTTLGSGDILPAGPFARTLSYFEAIVGQVFLVVLIARLVSLHVENSR